VRGRAGAGGVRGVAAQVEFESNVPKQFIIFEFQSSCMKALPTWLARVNLHRPTGGSRSACGPRLKRAAPIDSLANGGASSGSAGESGL